MKSDSRGHWCVFYNKVGETIFHTMKLQRSDGVLVAAKTYDEVFKFVRYKDAFAFVKKLIIVSNPKYNATVKRVCRARGDAFYHAGN